MITREYAVKLIYLVSLKFFGTRTSWIVLQDRNPLCCRQLCHQERQFHSSARCTQLNVYREQEPEMEAPEECSESLSLKVCATIINVHTHSGSDI